jgi:xanthine/CO dehydrogenase XdhC/CoxF family maturation factor
MALFECERAAQRALALAVVVQTTGSTYSKRGALMLFCEAGHYAGLLSGGCLEGDLGVHAQEVIGSGMARQVRYDSRGPDDLLFGLGSGCEGAMTVFLMRVGPDNGWQPLAHFQQALALHQPTAVGLVVESRRPTQHAGEVVLPEAAGEFATGLADVARSGRSDWLSATPELCVLALPLCLPVRLLLLGAGADARPLVAIAAQLGWRVAIFDHRPALADAVHFPGAERVIVGHPDALPSTVDVAAYDAVVIMSHHFESDSLYLRALARCSMPFVGLLGPEPRRERLRRLLGADFALLAGRLRSPVGLALGGRSSASVALAVVAEINAWLHGSEGGPFAARAGQPVVPPARPRT